jgi:hypothetical protein
VFCALPREGLPLLLVFVASVAYIPASGADSERTFSSPTLPARSLESYYRI